MASGQGAAGIGPRQGTRGNRPQDGATLRKCKNWFITQGRIRLIFSGRFGVIKGLLLQDGGRAMGRQGDKLPMLKGGGGGG